MSTGPTNPDELRGQIAQIDDQVLALTQQRSELTRVLAATQAATTGAGAAGDGVASVAFLGPAASFAHQAALARFGDAADVLPQTSIAAIFTAVEAGEAGCGVVPVENSTYGTVSDTFDMFYQTSANICGEVSLRIHHHLLSHGGFEDLEEICSHPQALGQCRRWLQRHLPHCQLTETSSTAEAARRAAAKKKTGALASKLAADWYEVPVIQENVEDSSDNFTRFVVLGRDIPEPTGDDKTSLLLVIEDRVGALFDALEAFKKNGINLSLIESRPSRLKSWTYYFFIDIAGHASEACCRKALDEVGTHCETIKCLGSYPRAQDPA